MKSLSNPEHTNGCAVQHRGKNEESHGEGSHSTEPDVYSNWNNIYLFLVCVLVPAAVMLILDGCRPPPEPWALFGSASVPLWDWTSLQIVVVFTALQGVLYYLPIGRVAEGKIGNNDKCLKYNINGLHAFVVTALLVVGMWYCGIFQGSTVTSRLLPLVCACTLVSLLLATGLYLRSLSANPSQLVHLKNNGKLLQEFALGKEIDPCVGIIDLKQFFMVRIGYIGWAMMDLSYLLTAIEMHGSPSLPLLLVLTFQLIYILDFLYDEDSVLTTKEYTEEPIGFLQIMGEYIWIPFFSGLPVNFLLHRPTHLHLLSAMPICLLFGFGFLVYYESNGQKNGFRKNPNDPAYACLETIPSPSGKKLLVSSWFGWVRHPNYLGDILMVFAWCLPCGFANALPYLPALQCARLLSCRAIEIEESCQKKHGEAWLEYCQRVPHKLVPYMY